MRNFWNWWLSLKDEEDILFDKEADFNANLDRSIEISRGLKIVKLLDYSLVIPFWLFIYTILLPYLMYKIHMPHIITTVLVVQALIIYLSKEFNNLNRVVLYKSTWKEYIFAFILCNALTIFAITGSLLNKEPLKGHLYQLIFNPNINYFGLCIVLNFVLIVRMVVYTYQKIRYYRKYTLKRNR